MANFVYIGDEQYQGLSTDTKPTNVPTGSRAFETDTGKTFVYNGSSWVIGTGDVTTTNTATLTNKSIDSVTNTVSNLGSFAFTIFKSGSTYYCRNNLTGAIAASNADPDTVFQTALTAGGNVFVQAGSYPFSGGFTGLDFPVGATRCNFVMDPNAFPTVPNGYTGYIFRMKHGSGSTGSSNNRLSGGLLMESGTPARNWEGVRLEGSGSAVNGVFHNTVENVQINYPNIGIRFYIDGTGTFAFINSNYIKGNLIYGAKSAFVDFDLAATYTAGNNGFYRNRFEYNLLQATNGTDATYGFKNIRHKENQFIGNYVADFTGAQITSNIHTDAQFTVISGGTMTALNFADASTTQTTKIIDETYGLKTSKITPGNAGTNLDIISTTTTNTTSWYNSALTERFYIQKNATQYLFDFVKQTAGGALRPALFRMYDVPGASPVESFRIDTDAIVKHATPIDLAAVSTPANPASNNGRLYVKAIDANNDGLFLAVKKSGGFVEVQIA